MRPKIPVVELLRVSTADQAEDDRAGLPRQEEANRRTIERHGLEAVRRVKLVDVSGACTMFAPEIQEMIRMIQAGQVRGIVLADLDRLLRPDDWTSFSVFQPIKEAGALLYLPDQVLDLNTQPGFLMSGLQAVIAGNELMQIKKRLHGAKEEKRRQGKCPQSYICLPLGVGFSRDTETWHYTPEAGKVRELFDLFLGGEHNLRELQRQTGLHHQTIKNLLRNQLYIGVRAYEAKRAPERRLRPDGRQADRRKVARAEGEVIRVKVIEEPLISPDDFWRVQELLEVKRDGHRARRSSGAELFLLQGLLRCAECGEVMYTVPGRNGPGKDYYYCRRKSSHFRASTGGCPSHYLHREQVEGTVLDFIEQRLADPAYVERHMARLQQGAKNSGAARTIEEATATLERLDRSRGRILELYTEGLLSRAEMDAKLAQNARERARAEARLGAVVAPSSLTPEAVAEIARTTANNFTQFSFWETDDQRQFLRMERPLFWINDSGITRFALPVGLNMSRHTGKGRRFLTPSLDQTFRVSPPFRLR